MFKRLLLAALASVAFAGIEACTVEEVWFEDALFSSEVEALEYIEALYGTNSRRTDTEYAGALYDTGKDTGDRYRINVGRGCRGKNTIAIRLPVIEGAPITAFWHTHGKPGRARSLFSPEDMAVVKSTARPFYLITPSGRLRVLTPSMIDKHDPRRGWHSGRPVQSLTSATNR